MTTVVHVREIEREWEEMPEVYVYIGRWTRHRSGTFGNPFPVDDPSDDRQRAVSLLLFEAWFLHKMELDPEYREAVEALRGKVLVCFCKPLRCHGDVIAEWLDR